EVKESSGSPAGFLANGRPMFVEGNAQGGRVMLSTVPFDLSWRSAFPQDIDFAVVVHQLFSYLAGAPPGTAEHNLLPGQPIRLRLDAEHAAKLLTLHLLDDDRLPARNRKPTELARSKGSLTFENTFETGPYRVSLGKDEEVFYVVHPDRRESDLTPTSKDDQKKVSDQVPMSYEEARQTEVAVPDATTTTVELWWCFMIGVVLLLCAEVWLTRQSVASRERHA